MRSSHSATMCPPCGNFRRDAWSQAPTRSPRRPRPRCADRAVSCPSHSGRPRPAIAATSQLASASSDGASMGRPVRNSSAIVSSNSSRLSTRTGSRCCSLLSSRSFILTSLQPPIGCVPSRAGPRVAEQHAARPRAAAPARQAPAQRVERRFPTRTAPPAPQGPARRSARTPQHVDSSTDAGPPASGAHHHPPAPATVRGASTS